MDPKIIAIVTLRGLGLAAEIGGRTRVADYLFTVAAGFESGLDVDAGMQAVADLLANRHATDDDWKAAMDRLHAAQADLHGPRVVATPLPLPDDEPPPTD